MASAHFLSFCIYGVQITPLLLSSSVLQWCAFFYCSYYNMICSRFSPVHGLNRWWQFVPSCCSPRWIIVSIILPYPQTLSNAPFNHSKPTQLTSCLIGTKLQPFRFIVTGETTSPQVVSKFMSGEWRSDWRWCLPQPQSWWRPQEAPENRERRQISRSEIRGSRIQTRSRWKR